MESDLLTQLGSLYNTDKATHHKFTKFYDEHLHSVRGNIENILEIGVEQGASLLMWRDYCPNAQIHGLDIHDRSYCNTERIKTDICDQNNHESLISTLPQINNRFDIIIDDGGHTMRQQQITLGVLFPLLIPRGYYILEDLHTSFIPYYIDGDCQVTTYNMLNNFTNTGIQSNYMSPAEIVYLNTHIETVTLWKYQDSITSIIRKKF
jgi:hypothetical protein